MLVRNKRYFLLGLACFLGVFLADQWSKSLILEAFFLPRPVMQVMPVFDIVLVWNHGVSFGMFAAQHQPLILIAVSLAIVAILLVWLARNTSPLVACALGFVMGGAIGNVMDRLRYGAVTDFLDFHIGIWHWPAFNIADSFIFIGVVLLCLHSMFMDKPIEGSKR